MSQLVNKSNLYSRKSLLKRVLVFAALLIIGVSFFYSSRLVSQLSKEERKKVELWAGAIEGKANRLISAQNLFLELSEVEEERIKLWAKATETLSSASGNFGSGNLAIDIIEANQTIPIILTNQLGEITSHRNVMGVIDELGLDAEELVQAKANNALVLDSVLLVMKERGDRIDINYIDDEYIYMYYKDSHILDDLRSIFTEVHTSFVNDIVSMASSTPVIYLRGDSVISSNKISELVLNDSIQLKLALRSMRSDNEPIAVDLEIEAINYIYYGDSVLLKTLKYYSIVQIGVVVLFVLTGYWLFSIFRRSEQNNVWVGMAKETAHQLGTPLSSLMGWMDVMRMKNMDESMILEMEKDVERLNMITDRFSKIGAKPHLEEKNVFESLETFVKYFRTRSPRKVVIDLIGMNNEHVVSPINEPLFHWVIENLCKNGIDAMQGNGTITIEVLCEASKTIVEVTDTGKGIPYNKRDEVFQPGFTSKARGWGLGLSLSKRIIKQYHNGKIWVKHSEQDKGTTFRIELKQ
ncbi:MAG: nitrogen-specific signal transduction histidine kinase [Salibacteraceae bacterium]|jgi:nitrogen-specific signal transduction histidine kinase